MNLGKAEIVQFLSGAHDAVLTEDGCERLYDDARVHMMRLVRSNRGYEDIESWRDAFGRVAALASAQTSVAAERLALRLPVLEHLLADHNQWKSIYNRETIFEMPHFLNVVKVLRFREDKMLLSECLAVIKVAIHAPVTILCELGLVDWIEENGDIYILLTPEGVRIIDDRMLEEMPLFMKSTLR